MQYLSNWTTQMGSDYAHPHEILLHGALEWAAILATKIVERKKNMA